MYNRFIVFIMRKSEAAGSMHRVRAISAKQNQKKLKTEMSQVQQHLPSYTFTSKRYGRLITTYNEPDVSRIMPKKAPKDRQELFQENLQLKMKINKLQSEIALQRGQLEAQRRKTFKYTKQLDREFEKQMYWTGNNQHLITGIKNQYEKLKQEYLEKCHQCEELKRKIEYTNQQEYKIYAETLQQNNRELTRRLQALLSQSEKSMSYSQKQAYTEYQLVQSSLLLQKTKKKLEDLTQRHSQIIASAQQKHKKIQFLQKLLIQKDNSQYHAGRKAKKLEKEKIVLQQNAKELRNKLEKIIEKHQEQMDALKIKMDRKSQMECQIFEKNIRERDNKISKLEKQVSYLTTLLSYWKPLDELKNIGKDQGQLNQLNAFQDAASYPVHLNIQKSERLEKDNLNATNRIRKQSALQGSNFPQQNRNSVSPSVRFSLNEDQTADINIQKQVRQRKTSDKKHTENAIKTRKVDLKDVANLSQIVKYRLVGHKFTIEKAKQLFDCSKEIEDQWIRQYITMGQVKKILQKTPFDLNEQKSNLLARYIVQDSSQEHIYCDQVNQISRSIAKSILKAFVGQYEIGDDESVENQWKSFLNKFEPNLKAALSSMGPNGYIDGFKLLELVFSLGGIQLSQCCKNYLLGKMSIVSNSMDNMKYEVIFQF